MLTRGLYHRAIIQSGVRSLNDPQLPESPIGFHPLPRAEETGKTVLEHLGLEGLSPLREDGDAGRLVMGTSKIEPTLTPADQRPYGLVKEDHMIPKPYSDIFPAGEVVNDVPILIGDNVNDGDVHPPTYTEDTLRSHADHRAGKWGIERFLALYADKTRHPLDCRNESAWCLKLGVTHWAKAFAQRSRSPVYGYAFRHPTPPTEAVFGSEVPFVLNSLDALDQLSWTSSDHDAADKISTLWANLVKSGNPNPTGSSEWPSLTDKDDTLFEVGSSFGAVPVATKEVQEFWYEALEQATSVLAY